MTNTVLALSVVVALGTGCAGTFGGPKKLAWHDHANRVGAALTVATMACDFGGTEQAALDGWNGREEGGMPARHVMGGTPSPGAVAAYFAGTTAILMVAAQIVPERFRPLFYSAVIGVEATAIVNNVGTTRGVCGLAGNRVLATTEAVGRR